MGTRLTDDERLKIKSIELPKDKKERIRVINEIAHEYGVCYTTAYNLFHVKNNNKFRYSALTKEIITDVLKYEVPKNIPKRDLLFKQLAEKHNVLKSTIKRIFRAKKNEDNSIVAHKDTNTIWRIGLKKEISVDVALDVLKNLYIQKYNIIAESIRIHKAKARYDFNIITIKHASGVTKIHYLSAYQAIIVWIAPERLFTVTDDMLLKTKEQFTIAMKRSLFN